jgi:large subunit ribosomal protein L6
METVIALPQDVKAKKEDYKVIIEGPRGTVSKVLKNNLAEVELKGNELIIKARKENRRGKCVMNTFKAHVNNLIKGVQQGFKAKLRICYAHFPITVKIQGSDLIIENFGGEKVPRKAKIMPGCEVKIDGSKITVTGNNKELIGQTAANIELATKVKNKDLRVFQDGIWIIKKPGRKGL